jgi:hypothetical protein
MLIVIAAKLGVGVGARFWEESRDGRAEGVDRIAAPLSTDVGRGAADGVEYTHVRIVRTADVAADGRPGRTVGTTRAFH